MSGLRTSLAIFQIGFALESFAGFVALSRPGSGLPYHSLILLLSPFFSVLGILWLWIGRSEWNDVHRQRVRSANVAFGASLLAAILAAAIVGYLSYLGPAAPPAWASLAFGTAIASLLALTFVTYVLVASHLVGPIGGVAMAFGLVWALLLSALIGLALSPQLQTIVQDVSSRNLAVGPVFAPVTLLAALFAFSYLAFFVAFADAYVRVGRGRAIGRRLA